MSETTFERVKRVLLEIRIPGFTEETIKPEMRVDWSSLKLEEIFDLLALIDEEFKLDSKKFSLPDEFDNTKTLEECVNIIDQELNRAHSLQANYN